MVKEWEGIDQVLFSSPSPILHYFITTNAFMPIMVSGSLFSSHDIASGPPAYQLHALDLAKLVFYSITPEKLVSFPDMAKGNHMFRLATSLAINNETRYDSITDTANKILLHIPSQLETDTVLSQEDGWKASKINEYLNAKLGAKLEGDDESVEHSRAKYFTTSSHSWNWLAHPNDWLGIS